MVLAMLAVRTAWAVDIRMGFTTTELRANNTSVQHDTCGILTGATDTLDEGLETDWPPPTGFTFDSWWFQDTTGGKEVHYPRLDLHHVPTAPPWSSDHLLNFWLVSATDTVRIAWENVPDGIDSLWIDDAALPPYGRQLHRVVTRADGPGEIDWQNPPPPAAQTTQFRVRVFYDPRRVGVDEPLPPRAPAALLWPNPASTDVHLDPAIGGSAQVRLFDVLGRQVRPALRRSAGTSFSVADLPNGVYLVWVTQAGAVRHDVLSVRK